MTGRRVGPWARSPRRASLALLVLVLVLLAGGIGAASGISSVTAASVDSLGSTVLVRAATGGTIIVSGD